MLELEYIFGLGKVYSLRFIESEICLQLFEYETQTEHRKRTPITELEWQYGCLFEVAGTTPSYVSRVRYARTRASRGIRKMA